MNKGKGVAVLLTLLAGLAIAPIAQAEATRTWVSGTGDDANPCSRTAPCKTFAGAISKTAVNGEIDAIDPGGFGAVTITKSITIDGRGTHASILSAGTNGINVSGAGISVRIKNLTINGAGTGVNGMNIIDAKSVRVENVHITGVTNRGISWTSSEAGRLFVKNTTVHDCGAKGLYFQGGASAASYLTVTNSSFDNSGGGVGVSGVTAPTVGILTNVTISGNTNPGLSADHNASVFFRSSTTVGNGTGIQSDLGALIRVSDSLIMANTLGVGASGGGSVLTRGDNILIGNTTDGAFTGTFPGA